MDCAKQVMILRNEGVERAGCGEVLSLVNWQNVAQIRGDNQRSSIWLVNGSVMMFDVPVKILVERLMKTGVCVVSGDRDANT